MQKEIEKLEVVYGVNFELADLLKKNGTMCLLGFDDCFDEKCNSKVFVVKITAWIYRGLSTIYFKHDLFHRY